jgi:hypothetical protein
MRSAGSSLPAWLKLHTSRRGIIMPRRLRTYAYAHAELSWGKGGSNVGKLEGR